MATKAAVRESEASDQNEAAGDGPLMDSVTAAVKKLIAKGKERGYITIDELNVFSGGLRATKKFASMTPIITPNNPRDRCQRIEPYPAGFAKK